MGRCTLSLCGPSPCGPSLYRSLVLIVACAFLFPVSAQDEDYTLYFSDGAGVGTSASITVLLDFSDGDALNGYQWGVCHDEDVLSVENADIEDGFDLSSISHTFQSVIATDGGWTVGALTNVITGETIDPTDGFEMFDVTYTVEDLSVDETEVEFCDTIGDPIVTTQLITTGAFELTPTTEVGTITLGVVDETFIFTLPDTTVVYGAGSGEETFTVSPTIQEHEDSPGLPNSTFSFSMAVEHDPDYLSVVEVNAAALIEDLNDGDGADFFGATTFDDGFTLGVIYAFADDDEFIEFEDAEEVIDIVYETVPDDLIDRVDPIETTLAWSSELGDPPTENTVVYSVSGDTSGVQLVDGVLTLEPLGELLSRGDCNANGAYNIGDAFGLMSSLFLFVGMPECEDACDVDDNGVLSILDALYMLEDLFVDGGPPADPYPDCGADPTDDDDLSCDEPCA